MKRDKPKNRTRWNAIVQDWSFVGQYSPNIYRCYRLSERAAVALLGIAEYLAWDNRWHGEVERATLRELAAAAERGLADPLSCDSDNCTFYDCMWPVFEYQYHWPTNPPLVGKSWSYDADSGTVYALSNIGRSAPEIYFTLPHGASCTIHLQTVLLGGKVMIFDGGITPIATVDTYADLTTIPPETPSEILLPIAAYTEDKLITVRFSASFDLEEIPVTFGGGFRGVTFCGDVSIMPYQLRQNADNPCLLEQSLNGGQTWLTAFDYSLCENNPPSVTTIYRYTNNVYQYSNDNGSTWNDALNPPNSQPATVAIPVGLDKWTAARCTAQTIRNVCQAWADAMIAAANPADLYQRMLNSMGFWWLSDDQEKAFAAGIGSVAATFSAISGAVLSLALNDQAVWDDIACDCYCRLEDNFSYLAANVSTIASISEGRYTIPLSTVIPAAIRLMGVTGMSNAARYSLDVSAYATNADACDCPQNCAATYTIINGTLIDQSGCILTIQSAPIPNAENYQSVDVQGTNGYCWHFVIPVFMPPHGFDFPHANYGAYCDGTPSDPIVTGQSISRATVQGIQGNPQFTIQLDIGQ